MESQDNHHHPPEHTFQETGSADREENTLAAPTSAAILKRMRLGRPSLLPEMDETHLLAALENSEWQVRVAVVQKLEEYGERAPTEPLLATLQDSAWQVREMALLALGTHGGYIPKTAFTQALQDEDESVRKAALFLQESYPDRFAETATNPLADISEKRAGDT